VPAFSAANRAMIFVLTSTHDGRLAVIELKADEDISSATARSRLLGSRSCHHTRSEFQKFGHFPGAELNEQSPLLLVAPALRIHTATEWNLIAVDEHWRQEVKPVFRKRSKNSIE
jgi:hypothetical protein